MLPYGKVSAICFIHFGDSCLKFLAAFSITLVDSTKVQLATTNFDLLYNTKELFPV